VIELARRQREFMDSLFASGEGAQRLEIYRRNVAENLHGALAATYPVVRRLVGRAFFREAARRFARASPSASGDLNGFGEEFAPFLRGDAHARSLPYLADVARLEWACHECYRAPEVEPFDFAALARVAPQRHGEIRFAVHPSVRLLESPYPIEALWEANQPDRDGSPGRDVGPDRLLVHREDHHVRVRRVERAEWLFLTRIAGGATLASACEGFSEIESESLLGATLARHVGEGVFSGFALATGEGGGGVGG
jgi:hypothetical protein